jgi:hypothetical protein
MTLSRRQLLGALAVGSAGGIGVGNTAALLADRETLATSLTAGIVDIRVAYWSDIGTSAPDLSEPDSVGDGSELTVDVDGLELGTVTRDLFRVRLPQVAGTVNNPARVWLRASCPDANTLAEVLSVRLAYSDASGTAGSTITSGSLRAVADDLRDGIALDGGPSTDADGCLADALFVVAEYELAGYVGSETVSLPLEFRAIQCRNTDAGENPFGTTGTAGINPFGTAGTTPCGSSYSCESCWMIGKVEVGDDGLTAGETYPFDEGLDGYGIAVNATDGDGGVAFTLVRDDGLPALPLCAVDIKGGPNYEHYPRVGGAFGVTTDVLDGVADGVVYTPHNGNSGTNYGISNIVVSVCAPKLADGSDPSPLTQLAKSGGKKP